MSGSPRSSSRQAIAQPGALSPGTYLRKRREAAGYGVIQAAASLAALPWTLRRPSADDRNRLVERINAAEEDLRPFSREHAELLRSVFAFDVEIYLQLVELRRAGAGSTLVVPQLCRDCACSWHDPCCITQVAEGGRTTRVGCAWSADPALCTACEDRGLPEAITGAAIELCPPPARAAA